ncbi:hypothetical protein ACOME3_003494 [Neoechinorhynchus agilis]
MFITNVSIKYERMNLGLHRKAVRIFDGICVTQHQLASLHHNLRSNAHPFDSNLFHLKDKPGDGHSELIWLVLYIVVNKSESSQNGLWKAVIQFQLIPGVVVHLLYADKICSITEKDDYILRSNALSVYSRLGQDSFPITSSDSTQKRKNTKRLINLIEDPKDTAGRPPLKRFRTFQYNPPFILSELSLDPTLPQTPLFHPSSDLSPLQNTLLRCNQSEASIDRPCLFFAYCLSSDKSCVLVTCSDERGELLETRVINATFRHAVHNAKCAINVDRMWMHIRRVAISRIWQFIVQTVVKVCRPVRLIITKAGILGFGELKSWACLLSRRSLHHWAPILRGKCPKCNPKDTGKLLQNHAPSIVSACLISLEPESSIRLYSQSIDHSASVIDVSCTHILTYPTSALLSRQLNLSRDDTQTNFDIIFDFDIIDTDFKPVVGLSNSPANPYGSKEAEDEVDENADICKLAFDYLQQHETEVRVDEQPLSVGLYVSTAPAVGVPEWMLARNRFDDLEKCTTFKVTLHVNVPNEAEPDQLFSTQRTSSNSAQSKRAGLAEQCAQCAMSALLNCSCPESKAKVAESIRNSSSETQPPPHPLDSTTTHASLKFILECFHRLSWLTLNETLSDRKSCLPLPIDVLFKIYHAIHQNS